MTFSAACDTDVDDGGASSESTVCNTIGTSWWNQGITEQTGTFNIEFTATPSGNNIDAVVGLANGPATRWTSLAAIVRFNPDGFIDARNGSAYAAVQSWRYGAGVPYYIRIEVDIRRHTYSAWASFEQGSYGSWNQIAANYAFRTEQASVTKLNMFSGFVNTTTGGELYICGLALNTLTAVPDGCVSSTAGGGFVNVGIAPGVHGTIVEFDATPSLSNMDGVVGVSFGKAEQYNHLAASIRFYTNGLIEARDGDTYRAALNVPYTAGRRVSFKFILDIENRTYTVWAYDGTRPPFIVAENWRFRPQFAVTGINQVATIVSSSSGRVDLCAARSPAPSNLRYARGGRPEVVPYGDGAVATGFNTGTNQTVKLDVNGKILNGRGLYDHPAVDASGNVYMAYLWQASTGAYKLSVDSYSPDLSTLRWARAIDLDGPSNVIGISVAGSRVLVALRQADKAVIQAVSTVDGSGGPIAWIYGNSDRVVAVGKSGWAVTDPQYRLDGTVFGYAIAAYDQFSSQRFRVTFDGSFRVSALAVAPDGSVVFGGEFYGQTANFGDREMHTIGNSEQGPFNGFFVALSPTGTLRYSAQTAANTVTDLDTNGRVIAVANYHYTQHPWVDFGVYDTLGNSLAGCGECNVGLGRHGSARSIVVTDHRVYLNVDQHLWWGAPVNEDGPTKPFMLAFDF
jgi:hypothetical protein